MSWIAFAFAAAGVGIGLVSAVVVALGQARARRRNAFRGVHVLVTGGSKGLGLALAKELVEVHEAHVTICARGEAELAQAAKTIRDAVERKNDSGHQGRVQSIPGDVTSYESMERLVTKAEGAFGPVDCLVNCAGSALTEHFLDYPLQAFESQMQLNYLGSVYPTRVVVKNMIERGPRPAQRIVFVSSQAGIMACMGYAAYAPSKYAVRGLAEALRHELLPHGISVHIAFPGNMNTPGYEVENRTKPVVLRHIESKEVLQEPQDTAKAILDSLLKGEYALYGGNLSGYALGRMGRGLAPHGTNLFVDVCLAPILVLIAWFSRAVDLDGAHKVHAPFALDGSHKKAKAT